MEKNLGSVDRGVRAVVGVAMLAGMFTWPHTIWGLVGVVPFSTAVVGVCPLYRIFGVSTCRTKS
ncbi:MAG: DUF2892 domain-containing protein [Rhodospirillales bacterium]